MSTFAEYREYISKRTRYLPRDFGDHVKRLTEYSYSLQMHLQRRDEITGEIWPIIPLAHPKMSVCFFSNSNGCASYYLRRKYPSLESLLQH